MKRIYVGTLLCIILSLGLLTGCDQGVARSLGGDMTLELEPGQKLEMITWKEDSLWYLFCISLPAGPSVFWPECWRKSGIRNGTGVGMRME